MAGRTESLLDAALSSYAKLVDGAYDRWRAAASQLEAGTYTSERCTADVLSTWADAAVTWWAGSLAAIAPYVSYVYMKIPLGTTVPRSAKLMAIYASEPKVTDLVQIGGSQVLRADGAVVRIAPVAGDPAGTFELIVTPPAATPRGVYLGMVYSLAEPVFVYAVFE